MVGRMPVLRQHDMLMETYQIVEARHDFIPALDGECATRAEIILDIDDDQNRLICHDHPRFAQRGQ